MTIRLKAIPPVLVGTIFIGVISTGTAEAALVRRTFTLNAGAPYIGTGSFEYDDDASLLTVDPVTGSQTTPLSNILFGYSSDPLAPVNDPLAVANFDRINTFLGADILIPGMPSVLDDLLISNEHAYIDFSSGGTFVNGAVTYSAPTPIPTPALLPGLIGIGVAAWRRKQSQLP